MDRAKMVELAALPEEQFASVSAAMYDLCFDIVGALVKHRLAWPGWWVSWIHEKSRFRAPTRAGTASANDLSRFYRYLMICHAAHLLFVRDRSHCLDIHCNVEWFNCCRFALVLWAHPMKAFSRCHK